MGLLNALTGTAALLCLAATVPVLAQDSELPPQAPQLPPPPLEAEPGSNYVIYPIRNGVFMISGPSANVAVQVGREGVLMVDSGAAGETQDLLKAVRRLSNKPI